MAGFGRISARQQQAISALLACPTVGEAAKASKIGERTVWRWLQDDAFQAAYREARVELVKQVSGRIQNAMGSAVSVLEEIMNDTNAPVSSRVSAAKTVLDMGLKSHELGEIEIRLDELEKQVRRR